MWRERLSTVTPEKTCAQDDTIMNTKHYAGCKSIAVVAAIMEQVIELVCAKLLALKFITSDRAQN